MINAEHVALEAFNEDDLRALKSLAAQAGIAIQNARQFEELKRTRGIVGARTAVAWMGMASTAWRHTIGNHATTIQDRVKLLRQDIAPNDVPDIVNEHLLTIDQLATDIRNTPITAPLSNEEGVSPIDVNEIVQERFKQLKKRYDNVALSLSLDPNKVFSIRVSAEWLKRAFDILIENALEAMNSEPQKKLIIATRAVDQKVEIVVDDTGRGIPDNIKSRILKEPIEKPEGAKGSGVGLLIAQTIVQAYGGDIYIEKTSSTGTTMVISFPHETPRIQKYVVPSTYKALLVLDQQQCSSLRKFKDVLSQLAEISIATEDQALGAILQDPYHAIIVDSLSVGSLTDFIDRVLERQVDAKVIVITASPTWRMTREVLQAGAYDYINKSLSPKELFTVFKRVLED